MRTLFSTYIWVSVALLALVGCEATRPQSYTELDDFLNPGVLEVETALPVDQPAVVADVPAAVSAVVVTEADVVSAPETTSVKVEEVVVMPAAVSSESSSRSLPLTAVPVVAHVPPQTESQTDVETEESAESALTEQAVFRQGETSVMLVSAEVGKRWTFDAYGDERTRREAAEGKRYVTAKLTVSSSHKNPALFGIGVYVGEGHTLKLAGRLEYRFARWREQAAYLGNYPDGMNDFAVTRTVPFSLGALVSEQDAKRPLYLVVSGEGCHERQHNPHAYPTESYLPLTCPSLKKVLKARDFSGGKLVVLKRFD